MKYDYLIKSTAVFNSVDDRPFPGGVVVSGNRIAAVVPASELAEYENECENVLDYGDRLVMPGLIDAHIHAGSSMDYVDEDYCVNVSSATTFDGVMEIIKGFAEAHPDNRFIFGIGLNFFDMTDGVHPTAAIIDSYISDRPVIIQTLDLHSYFTNSKGIEFTGITKDTTSVIHACGKYDNGELSGEFNDTAAFIVTEKIGRSFEERRQSMRGFMKKLNACGITSIGDVYPAGDEQTYPMFKSIEDELTVRVNFFPNLLEFTPEQVNRYKEEYASSMLQFSGLKVFVDGVLSNFTAWMLEPYTNDPSTCGAPTNDPDLIREKTLQACSMGINVRAHAVGDRAIRFMLDTIEEAQQKYGPIERKHGIEHLEFMDPADIKRFVPLGVIPSFHPEALLYFIKDTIDYLGPEREGHTLMIRDVLDSCPDVGTGSDFPVHNFNPMPIIRTGVTRRRVDGTPEGGWHPEQCIELNEMLKMYTAGSAAVLNRENEIGTLENGKLADITVMDCNLFDIDIDEVRNAKPVMTMVDGRIVYEAE